MPDHDTHLRFDRNDQVERIRQYVVPGETLHAVFDCKGGGTGFVGLTDRRLIFYDQSFLHSHRSMISIPYWNIVGVAAADEGALLKPGEITLLTSAGRFAFEFRETEHAHWAYEHIMSQILITAQPPVQR